MQRATVSDICQSGVLSADVYAWQLLALEAKSPGRVRLVQAVYGYAGEHLMAATEPVQSLEKLRGRLLVQPLALNIAVANAIDSTRLLVDLNHCLLHDHFFAALHEQRSLTAMLVQALDAVGDADLLWQHLTLMAEQMPELYRKTLLSVLLVMQLAMEMRLGRSQTIELFWAALGHDIGMLYVAPAILGQPQGLGLGDWAQIQSHVAIGEQLLGQVASLPGAVSLAVYEHQERCDGTGYPLGKVETELSLYGQLLSLADSAVAIYCNRLAPQGRSWRDLIPIIELAAQEYLLRAVELLSALVRRSDLPMMNVVAGSNRLEFMAQYQRQQERLQHWFTVLKEGLLGLGYTHRDRQLYALQNLVLHLATAYRGLLVQVGATELLTAPFATRPFATQPAAAHSSTEKPSTDPSSTEPPTAAPPTVAQSPATQLLEGEAELPLLAARNLQDAWVLQQEVEFHLQRLSLMLQQYLAAEGSIDAGSRARLADCLAQITPYLP